jgi:four helix bundle protein
LHFLQIALASLAEVGYCIHAAHRLGYLKAVDTEALEKQLRMVSAPLRGLMKSLGRANP